MPKCQSSLDIGFILDASVNLPSEYEKEKTLIKNVVDSFGLGLSTTRVGVIAFGDRAEISVKLSRYDNLDEFKSAITSLPLLGSENRIDKALQLAKQEFFLPSNGGR